MMIIPFDKIQQYDITVSKILAIRQEPSYRILKNNGRACNGIILILNGACRYEYEGGSFTLSEGSAAYLPFGSRHTMTVMSDAICFYRVDFTIYVDGEIVLFSDGPMKITDHAPQDCLEATEALVNDYAAGGNSLKRLKNLSILLSGLQKISASPITRRLMPALAYLDTHVSEGVDCRALAELCYLSKSRFYELFKTELGVTPLLYRDRLLIRRASSLLSAGDLTVGECAQRLGFDTAAYFSRFFKKHTGMTPSQYQDTVLTDVYTD